MHRVTITVWVLLHVIACLLSNQPQAAEAQPRTTPPGHGDTATSFDTDAFARAVRRVSDGQYLVARGQIEALAANPNALMRVARAIPHQVNGVVDGVKLYGIRQHSPLAVLGFQNGDLLQTVNGHSLSDPSAALAAYSELRAATRLEVVIERRGKAQRLVYRIVDHLPRARRTSTAGAMGAPTR